MIFKKSKKSRIDGILKRDSFSSRPAAQPFSLSESNSSTTPEPAPKTKATSKWLSRFHLSRLPRFSRRSYIIFFILFLAAVVIYANKYRFAKPGDNEKLLEDTVITEDTKLAVDQTFHLEIVVMGQKQAIPNTFGKVEGGRTIINSNSDDGTIRVQSPIKRKFFLTDFFTIWGATFNSRCIFTHCANSKRQLTMYVNDEVNQEYQNYQIQDGDNIRIVIESIK